jgi:hypothetical protein
MPFGKIADKCPTGAPDSCLHKKSKDTIKQKPERSVKAF